MNKRKLLGLLCFLVAAAALAAAILLYGQSRQAAVLPTPRLTPSPTPTAEPSATPSPEPTPWPSADDGGFPQDKVFITEAREAYVSGTMRLIVPKLEIDIPILDGTSESTLLQGEGLYDYAQMPQEVGGNVSIAGHRNWIRNGQITDDVPFYYLHLLGPGDTLYLVYEDVIYQYVWDKTSIVEPDDWSVIYCQGFSCLTLTTCTPISVADHRYVVRARQVDSFPYTKDYDYPDYLNIGTADPSPIPTEEVTP
ncbi:hypothetical protein B5E80_13675 [Flavonifractor sp. An135]|nr:class E sortase [Flavonifractor sp. An135]OUQ22425.1 hypothetical protein B5E80_13675 [Flavonifractor sp. An135]